MSGESFDFIWRDDLEELISRNFKSDAMAEARAEILKEAPDYVVYHDEFLKRLEVFSAVMAAFAADLFMIQGLWKELAYVKSGDCSPQDLASSLPKMLPDLEDWRLEKPQVPAWIEEEINAVLGKDPDTVRCREGGGPENILASLAVTMAKTREARDQARAPWQKFAVLFWKMAELMPKPKET